MSGFISTTTCRICFDSQEKRAVMMKMKMLTPIWMSEYSLVFRFQNSEEENRKAFEDFWEDIVQEFLRFGPLLYCVVSSNTAPHLRGNVYVVWETREIGEIALQKLQGRFYAGRRVRAEETCEMQLEVEYLPESVICWKYGLCAEYRKPECSRGKDCAFLHLYSYENEEWGVTEQKSGRKIYGSDKDWKVDFCLCSKLFFLFYAVLFV